MTRDDLAAACLADLAQVEEWERRVLHASETAVDAKRIHESACAFLLTSGQAEGRNDKEREAWVRRETYAQRQATDVAEHRLKAAQAELRIVMERLKTHRALLRALSRETE